MLTYHPVGMLRTSLVSLMLMILLAVSASCLTPPKQKKIAHKDDVVIMDNGDRVTGEIKKMEFGVLYLKSDRVADTLRLDWKRVMDLQSKIRYEFELMNRRFYVGVIVPAIKDHPAEILLQLDNGSMLSLNIAEIIGIREMQRAVLGRLNFALDAGFSFTSANNYAQTTVHSHLSFQKPKYSGSLDVDSLFSGERGAQNTSRHQFQIEATRVLNRKWELASLLTFLNDDQQELDLRTTVGGGVQRIFIKSNRTLFSGLIGAVYTKENYFALAESDRSNAEILTGVTFATYHFRGSELNSSILLFPSLSDPGRIRADLYVNWKWDIISDLYWRVSLTNNYDSRPPASGINNNLSLTSSVGWSF
jgi:hypothetical protein